MAIHMAMTDLLTYEDTKMDIEHVREEVLHKNDAEAVALCDELWCLLNEEFSERIDDLDSHDQGEVLREILELVQRHFVLCALAYHPTEHEPISQQELDDRVENLVLYGQLLALVRRYGIIAVVEAFEQVGRTMQGKDADDL